SNFHRGDTFTYTASDGSLRSDVAPVSIAINAVNDAPDGATDSYTTTEDTALTIAAPGVLGNDTDVDSATITAVLVAGPTHGTLTLTANGGFMYTPAANYNGPDSFTYKANDGSLDSNVATVTIAVAAVNDPPVANNDTATTAEDTAITIAVLANDTDVDADSLAVTGVSAPLHGSATSHPDGTITY